MTLIRRTFRHLPGIGGVREARLWDAGIFDWQELMESVPKQLGLFRNQTSQLEQSIEESERALAEANPAYFAGRLPRSEHYRIAESFPEQCVFLDIESTGLSSYYDNVTVVGWSRGESYSALIGPSDVEALERDLVDNPIVVTFNGSLFDLPFLQKKFGTDWSRILHIDLRFLAKRANLTGGQKKIEEEIGLARKGSLKEISGPEAVALWFDYKHGDQQAIETLLQYNHADVEGMKYLFEEVLNRISNCPPRSLRSKRLFSRSQVVFDNRKNSREEPGVISVSDYNGPVGPNLTLNDLANTAPRLLDVTVVGIDLTGSEKRKSGWASVLGEKLETKLISTDEELIATTVAAKPYLVSIDSPLSLPAGRVTEFDDDPGRKEFGIMRQAERQLKRRGINVYPALLPSMQKLTRRGVSLATQLRKLGIPVIESYPGAAQDILGIPRKKTSLKYLEEGLSGFGYTGQLSGDSNVSHDELDAATSALVGQFMLAGYWESLGSDEEDFMIVPTIKPIPNDLKPTIVIGLSGSIAAGKTTVAKMLQGMGFRYCRFSEVLESELRSAGQAVNRQTLQALGSKIHHSRFGQRQLQIKLAALVQGADKIVIDGLRHPEDHAFLYERWGFASVHLHIEASKEIRAVRYVSRGNTTESEFYDAEKHEIERSASNLMLLADHIVENRGSLADLESQLSWIGEIV